MYSCATVHTNWQTAALISLLLYISVSASVYHHPAVKLTERNVLLKLYRRGKEPEWVIDTMWWHLWNGRYHFRCYRVLLDVIRRHVINMAVFIPTVIVPKWCFRMWITIEFLLCLHLQLAMLTSVAFCEDEPAHLYMVSILNTCPWWFWHRTASFFPHFFLCSFIPCPYSITL